MNGSSDIEKKIVSLQEEIDRLKVSQIVGGDNSRIYSYYIEGESAPFYKKNGVWVTKSEYEDPEWIPIPMSITTITSAIYSLVDDPFALIGFEKIEIWRKTKLLTLGNYNKCSDNFYGQANSDGDRFIVRYAKDGSGWGQGAAPTLGTKLLFEASPMNSLSESWPFSYTYKVWLRSTSNAGYGFVGESL